MRRFLWVALALSFAPYAVPRERRPKLYTDGKTPRELARRRKERRVSAFVGGDITSIEFGQDLFLDERLWDE